MVRNVQSNTGAYWAYEDFSHFTLFTSGSIYYVLKMAGFDEIMKRLVKKLIRLIKGYVDAHL
ncbi:MAG: hypothetical protein ACP5HC_08750 [Caldisericum sp.]